MERPSSSGTGRNCSPPTSTTCRTSPARPSTTWSRMPSTAARPIPASRPPRPPRPRSRCRAGRLYAGGEVHARNENVVIDVFNSLPLVTRKRVAIVAFGQSVDTDVQPRDFLIDAQVGTTEPQSVAMENLRRAELSAVAGTESPDPAYPPTDANVVVICYALLDTSGIVSIEQWAPTQLPNLRLVVEPHDRARGLARPDQRAGRYAQDRPRGARGPSQALCPEDRPCGRPGRAREAARAGLPALGLYLLWQQSLPRSCGEPDGPRKLRCGRRRRHPLPECRQQQLRHWRCSTRTTLT